MQIGSEVTAIFHFLSLTADGKRATAWAKGWERNAGMAVIGPGTHGVGGTGTGTAGTLKYRFNL